MDTRLQQITNHVILCGYGRVGRQVAQDLRREDASLVVIDVNQDSLTQAAEEGLLVVHGNAADDLVLRSAGIQRARALITSVAHDADNIFVTLSAHALRGDLPIVARANYPDAVNKLRLAGATRVVSPYTMAGQQMAMLAVRPAAVDFVETLLRGTSGSLLLEDIELEGGASLVGLTLPEVRGRFGSGATVLAVRRAEQLLAPPSDELRLATGDVIVVAGTDKQLRELEQACTDGALPVSIQRSGT